MYGKTAILGSIHVGKGKTFQTKLEIWGKAQRESARHPKSNWGKLRG